jgi:hypothetical protein
MFSLRRFNTDNPSEADAWDAFVRAAHNGTIFHTRRFLSYHLEGRFVDHSLVVEHLTRKKGSAQSASRQHDTSDSFRPTALIPAVEMLIDKDRVLYSHRGASYGGIVTADASLEETIHCVQALKRYAREQGFSKIILTQPPLLYAVQPSQYIDFALLRAGFRYQKRELTAIMPIPALPAAMPTPERIAHILGTFKPEARTAARKAMKLGVETRTFCSSDAGFDEALRAYYAILSRNLMMRHGVHPTHTHEELARLCHLFPEHIWLHAAYLHDMMIAGVVNFCATPSTVLGFYISDNKEFQEYRSLNYLFAVIVDWCSARNVRWYDFGTFTLNMEPNIGLGRFKETFGARGVFRDTLEILVGHT